MRINKPIGIRCGDIYLEFPEIMEEEFNDLIDFLDDEKIIYKGATKRFKDMQHSLWEEQELNEYLQDKINKASKKLKKIDKDLNKYFYTKVGQKNIIKNLLEILDKK